MYDVRLQPCFRQAQGGADSRALHSQAVDALCAAAEQLPAPVVLEHIARPVVLSLDCGPDSAVALVCIGSGLGGELAARHLLGPLLGVLASSGSRPANLASQKLRAGTRVYMISTVSAAVLNPNSPQRSIGRQRHVLAGAYKSAQLLQCPDLKTCRSKLPRSPHLSEFGRSCGISRLPKFDTCGQDECHRMIESCCPVMCMPCTCSSGLRPCCGIGCIAGHVFIYPHFTVILGFLWCR